MNDPLIYVLLVAGAVAAGLGERVDAAVIFGVVVLNTLVGYVQESRAQSALEALRAMTRTQVTVVRDGRARRLASEDLVPGDLVLVEAGDKVPADLRLVRETGLQADESALTGESVPVVKDQVVLPADTPVADRRNMLFSGTMVTSGSGAGVTVATGVATELGEIHRLVGGAEVPATPLTRKLARFSTVLTAVILGLAAVTFVIGLARGGKRERYVHRRGRAGGGGDPGGTASRGDDRPGNRGGPDGPAAGGGPPAAGRGNPGAVMWCSPRGQRNASLTYATARWPLTARCAPSARMPPCGRSASRPRPGCGSWAPQ